MESIPKFFNMIQIRIRNASNTRTVNFLVKRARMFKDEYNSNLEISRGVKALVNTRYKQTVRIAKIQKRTFK